MQQLEKALEEIKEGKHSTSSINFAKDHIGLLVESQQFDDALKHLHELAEARKLKTTNILWIGGYLKDLYFHDNGTHLKEKFDKLLLDEMLFYYLKSCKLYEKGYQDVREALKKLA